MHPIDVSIIGPCHRPHYWMELYNSIRKSTHNIEFIFVTDKKPDFKLPDNFRYIYSTVKPAQCVEIAIREARGEVIHWTSDPTTYRNISIDMGYNMYKKANNYKTMIRFRNFEGSKVNLKTRETTQYHNFLHRTQYSRDHPEIYDSKVYPMMPYGMMSRKLIEEVGRLDRRFVAGQWDNDLVMRAYAIGATMIDNPLAIAYTSTEKHDGEWHLRGPMHYYESDLLIKLWVKNYHITLERQMPLEPFEDKDLLTVSQGIKGCPKGFPGGEGYEWK